MRKKSGFTIVEQAIALVPEFENVAHKPNFRTARPETTAFYPANTPSNLFRRT